MNEDANVFVVVNGTFLLLTPLLLEWCELIDDDLRLNIFLKGRKGGGKKKPFFLKKKKRKKKRDFFFLNIKLFLFYFIQVTVLMRI